MPGNPPRFDLEAHWVNHPRGADVEIVEPWSEVSSSSDTPADELPCIKPYVVRVNGTDVGLIARDGITVDVGDGRAHPASVTLVLLARAVTLKAE